VLIQGRGQRLTLGAQLQQPIQGAAGSTSAAAGGIGRGRLLPIDPRPNGFRGTGGGGRAGGRIYPSSLSRDFMFFLKAPHPLSKFQILYKIFLILKRGRFHELATKNVCGL
jgi:hypothetical protein